LDFGLSVLCVAQPPAMSYAGGSGNVCVSTKTSPARRKPPNPEGHKQLIESPLPYRQEDPAEPPTRYCDTVNGVVPGYAGHRPRAQHTYGKAAFGDPQGLSHAAELRMKGELVVFGDMGVWHDGGGTAKAQGIDGEQTGHPDTKAEGGVWAEGLTPYAAQVGGVLPGYGGHVPRALHTYGVSAKGMTPPFATSNEHEEIAELRELFSRSPKVRGLESGDFVRSDPNDDGEEWWPQAAPNAAIGGIMTDFRDMRNGLLPKYAGHIPKAKDKYGASAVGHTRTIIGEKKAHLKDQSNSGVNTGNELMGQINRQNTKTEVPFNPTMRHDGNGVIPGYKGHVPNVVNAVGMSTFLSGPGYTEVKVENMEKMGGAGDLGDSAAAYGCNDQGASSFSDDGVAEGLGYGDGPMADGHASALEKSSMAAAGHIDQYTFGDASADAAAEAIRKNAEYKKKFEEAKRAARGF